MSDDGRGDEGQDIKKQHGMFTNFHNVRLPLPEHIFYAGIGIGSLMYALYSVFKDSNAYMVILNTYDFEDGWKSLGHKKDISDFEWTFWYGYFWKLLPWHLGHVTISIALELEFQKSWKYVYLTYSLLCVSFLMNWRTVLFYIGYCCLIYCTSMINVAAVWLANLSLLATMDFDYSMSFMTSLCAIPDKPQGGPLYLFLFVLALVNLRSTSFCLEKCSHIKSTKKTHDDFGMLDLLMYTFYLPLFFTGPTITYDKFVIQINKCQQKWTWNKLYPILKNTVRVLFWAVFIEFILHYMYFSAMMHNVSLLKNISPWTIAGIGYSIGQFFMVKYVVLYGLPSQVARLNHLDPPRWPKCISYIIRYSEMWKFFDRGLYDFLKRYIYIPLGGSQGSMLHRLAGSLACFMFIYLWHGIRYHIFIWSVINFVGCALEWFAVWLEQTGPIVKLETELLSPRNVRRLHAFLMVPLLLMSHLSAFYFFGGKPFGSAFLDRLVINTPITYVMGLYFIFYCCVQNAFEIEQRLKTKRD